MCTRPRPSHTHSSALGARARPLCRGCGFCPEARSRGAFPGEPLAVPRGTHRAEQRHRVGRGAVLRQDGGAAAEAEGHLRNLPGRQAKPLRFGALRVLRRQRGGSGRVREGQGPSPDGPRGPPHPGTGTGTGRGRSERDPWRPPVPAGRSGIRDPPGARGAPRPPKGRGQSHSTGVAHLNICTCVRACVYGMYVNITILKPILIPESAGYNFEHPP